MFTKNCPAQPSLDMKDSNQVTPCTWKKEMGGWVLK